MAGSRDDTLSDALQLALYLFLLAVTLLLVWALGKISLSWDVTVIGYIIAAFELTGISLLCAIHTMRLFRRFLSEIRRTIKHIKPRK